jgi:hypothetical protein
MPGYTTPPSSLPKPLSLQIQAVPDLFYPSKALQISRLATRVM